jgi:hypothetical protein
MTESTWLTATDPLAMSAHLGTRFSKRKQRLFACAWLREEAQGMIAPPEWNAEDDSGLPRGPYETEAKLCGIALRDALSLAERFADGKSSDHEREGARACAMQWGSAWASYDVGFSYAGYLAAAANETGKTILGTIFDQNPYRGDEVGDAARAAVRERQANLIREIVGNPFRPVSIPSHWLRYNDGILLKLARQIYHNRDHALMPFLADALLDAGCGDEMLLAHCRAPNNHVLGCWVVDRLLGKE